MNDDFHEIPDEVFETELNPCYGKIEEEIRAALEAEMNADYEDEDEDEDDYNPEEDYGDYDWDEPWPEDEVAF